MEQTTTPPVYDFQRLIPDPLPRHVFRLDDAMVWCNGVVRGDDGLYHMFFSRWPAHRGHEAWVTDSEVAHAVADSLSGPYRFVDVALPRRGRQYWDGDVTHNPHCVRVDGRYYLYHMGTRGSGYWDTSAHLPTMTHSEWWVNRNNQRVGVAVADSPYGPWTRYDAPLIDVVPGRRLTSTPAVMVRADGRMQLIYKTVIEGPGHYGLGVRHIITLAEHPLGPFEEQPLPFIEAPATGFPIDDHVEWHQDGRYWCIAKDHGEGFTGESPALVLFESTDGLTWRLAANPLVMPFRIAWAGGCTQTFDRLEMPKLYLEKGRPRALFLAAKPTGEEHSFSVAVPLGEWS